MVEKTNKVLIILVSVLIILLIIAVILFSMIINKDSENENQTQLDNEQKEYNLMEIENIEKQEENEVLVAILGDSSNENNSVVVIGANENYNENINNVVENNSSPYYIKVNVQTNTVTIYKKDGNGNYNIPLKAMVCSCGSATPVEGTYGLKRYNNWEWKTLYGKQYGRYATQISGDFIFSSVPYKTKGDITTLNYEEYDKLGTISTIGNIQLTVADAKWIYDNCEAGTQVTFYTSEIASPLNITETKLITEDEEVRGWDPTDPAENNPWRVYVRPERNPAPEPSTNNNEENNNNNQNTNTTNNNTENTVNTVNTNTTQNTNTVENNNTTTNNNVVDNNNTVNNTNTVDNTVQNTTVNSNTINNNIPNNNTIQNNVNTTNTVLENRILENNKDVTITSEIM